TWIAQTQSAGLGALAMGAFSIGLGLPFFAVGAFAMQLPKSGQWMVSIKSVLGVVMVVVALYFLGTAFPAALKGIQAHPLLIGVTLSLIVVGVLFGAIHKDFHSPEWKDRISKGFGLLLTSGGTFVLLTALAAPTRS